MNVIGDHKDPMETEIQIPIKDKSPVFVNDHPQEIENKPISIPPNPPVLRSPSQQEIRFAPPRKNSNFTFSHEKLQTAFKYQPSTSTTIDESDIELVASLFPP